MTSKNRHRRPNTVTISLANRGQTTQDFAVGIGVFLLAMAFVFSYVPSLLVPFASDNGGEPAQADRIAALVVDDLSETQPNHLNGSAFNETYATTNSTVLASDLGLRATDTLALDRVNVSIERLNQSVAREARQVIAGGDTYASGEPAASAGRIVTVDFDGVSDSVLALDGDDPDDVCTPACRLVVRVW